MNMNNNSMRNLYKKIQAVGCETYCLKKTETKMLGKTLFNYALPKR